MDSEQTGYLGRLEIGWAVVKLQGRWFFPFLVKLPLFHIRKGTVTDSIIRDRMKRLLAQGRELLCENQAYSALISTNGNNSGIKNTKDRNIPPFPDKGKREEIKDKKESCTIRLTTQERNFLMDVWQFPTSSVTERYRRLCFSYRSGNNVQNSLIKNGFIYFSFVVLYRGRIKILTLTEKGRKVLGIKSGQSDRHGGPEHKYWVKRIVEHLRSCGYKVDEEAPVGGGKTIDVIANKNGRRIAFEIETGKSDAAANVKKCLKSGFDTVFVITTSNRAHMKILSRSEGLPRGKVIRAMDFFAKKYHPI